MLKKEVIIDKIKKLLALSKSSNEHEAALAVTKARSLLTEYNLSISDIDLSTDNKIKNIIENTIKVTKRRWYLSLAGDVAPLFNCEALRVYRNGRHIVFIGMEVDSISAKHCYLFLVDEILRLVNINCQDKRNSNSYVLGLLCGIHETIRGEIEKIKKNEVKCNALVIKKDKLIEDYMGKEYPNSVEIKDSEPADMAEFRKGCADGKNISLSKQLDNENDKLKIKGNES